MATHNIHPPVFSLSFSPFASLLLSLLTLHHRRSTRSPQPKHVPASFYFPSAAAGAPAGRRTCRPAPGVWISSLPDLEFILPKLHGSSLLVAPVFLRFSKWSETRQVRKHDGEKEYYNPWIVAPTNKTVIEEIEKRD